MVGIFLLPPTVATPLAVTAAGPRRGRVLGAGIYGIVRARPRRARAEAAVQTERAAARARSAQRSPADDAPDDASASTQRPEATLRVKRKNPLLIDLRRGRHGRGRVVLFAVMTWSVHQRGTPTSRSPRSRRRARTRQTIQDLVIPVFAIAGSSSSVSIGVVIFIGFQLPRQGRRSRPPTSSGAAARQDRPRSRWTIAPRRRARRHRLLHRARSRKLNAAPAPTPAGQGRGPAVVVALPLRRRPTATGNGTFDDPERRHHRRRARRSRSAARSACRETSNDVIHSFWIPALNGKKDAVPGHRTPTGRSRATSPASSSASAPSSAGCPTPTCACSSAS